MHARTHTHSHNNISLTLSLITINQLALFAGMDVPIDTNPTRDIKQPVGDKAGLTK